MVEGCGGVIWDHGCWVKDEVAGDSKLGSRSARRSTQRSVAEWSAEPGAEAAQFRRAGGAGVLGVLMLLSGLRVATDRPRLELGYRAGERRHPAGCIPHPAECS